MDSMENLIMNSNDKKGVGFRFDLEKKVGFEKLPFFWSIHKVSFYYNLHLSSIDIILT